VIVWLDLSLPVKSFDPGDGTPKMLTLVTPEYCREKAAQCRRLGAGIGNEEIRARLKVMAGEFDAKAAAAEAELKQDDGH
jgi:hypothetical protein